MPRSPIPLVVLALLGLVGLVNLPTPALADPPTPMNSTIPNSVLLVGLGPAGPDSALGHCVVTYRDLANNPVPGAVIFWDFSACDAVWIADDQHDPRVTVDCAARTISAITDQNGSASFTFVGGGLQPGSTGPQVARVYADGLLLGSVKVSAFDLDGSDGVTVADLSFWSADYFSATNPDRSDYNAVGGVTIADLARWALAFFGGNQVESGTPHCP
jgi:hypothetical protein